MWARLCVWFGAVLMVGSGLLLIGGRMVTAAANSGVNQRDLLGPAGARAHEQHVSINGAKTILLVGLDARPGQDPAALVRADSIMLLHVNAAHDRAYLVSLPRDTYVHIPAYPATQFAGRDDKMNAAFAFGNWHGGGIAGGVQLLATTIQSITGIVPNAAMVIDFTGFRKLVGVLGGVDMCVDEKTTSIHIGVTADGRMTAPYHINSDGTVGARIRGVTPMVYQKGCQHLEAWQALDYVRQRDLLANHDYDYGRQRHQQQFIKAIFRKVFSAGTLTNFGKLNQVLAATRDAMTMDTQGISPVDWVYAMRGISPGSVVTIKTNGGTFNPRKINGIDYEVLSDASMRLLRAVRDDTVDEFIAQYPGWVSTS